jgi:tRNA pseudouridine32 synthase/23S rRNA pseudouridine746 synthase
MKIFVIRKTVESHAPVEASDFLTSLSGLSKTKVKDAMNKGAVWLKKEKGKLRRLRRVTTSLIAGDYLEFYYDERLLSIKPPDSLCISDQKHYSVWFKPAGIMSQGTMYGDHCSLMRQAELFFKPPREEFLAHRLDREASGVMILAHHKDAAAKISELFRRNLVLKGYRVEVLGHLADRSLKGTIDMPLDGKTAVTEYEMKSYDRNSNTSLVHVIIKTGRLHQIRRHFELIGFPVMGDPKYGKGNKNAEGMKLSAVFLQFVCPYQKRKLTFSAPGF